MCSIRIIKKKKNDALVIGFYCLRIYIYIYIYIEGPINS